MLNWGATQAEIADGNWQSVRAVTIQATPDRVWPWLAQIGQTRGGFYSYTWIENLLGCEMVNAAHIHPEWQVAGVGERIYLAPPGRFDGRMYMVVARLVRGESLDLTTPDDWDATTNRLRRSGHIWSLTVTAMPGGRSRLIARARALPLEPAHFIMERAMLLGIKERAESTPRTVPDQQSGFAPSPAARLVWLCRLRRRPSHSASLR